MTTGAAAAATVRSGRVLRRFRREGSRLDRGVIGRSAREGGFPGVVRRGGRWGGRGADYRVGGAGGDLRGVDSGRVLLRQGAGTGVAQTGAKIRAGGYPGYVAIVAEEFIGEWVAAMAVIIRQLKVTVLRRKSNKNNYCIIIRNNKVTILQCKMFCSLHLGHHVLYPINRWLGLITYSSNQKHFV